MVEDVPAGRNRLRRFCGTLQFWRNKCKHFNPFSTVLWGGYIESLEEDVEEEVETRQSPAVTLETQENTIRIMEENLSCINPEELSIAERVIYDEEVRALEDMKKTFAENKLYRQYQEALRLKREADKFLQICEFNRAVTSLAKSLASLHIGGSDSEKLREKPGNWLSLETDIYVELSACMMEQEKYTKCIEFCEKVLKVRPTCVKSCFRDAVATYSLGQHRAASPKFEKALKAVKQARLAKQGQDVMLSEISKSSKAYLKSIQLTSLDQTSKFRQNFEDSRRVDIDDSCSIASVSTHATIQETGLVGDEVTRRTPFL